MSKYKAPQDGVMLAGWVFADLLLGLMLIFMAAQHGETPSSATRIPDPTRTPTPTATSTTAPTPTPRPTSTTQDSRLSTATPILPTPTPRPPSLSRNRVEITIELPSGLSVESSAAEKSAFRQKLQRALLDQKFDVNQSRAGILLAFGGAPRDNPNAGNKAAERMNVLLADLFPRAFGGSAVEAFHDFGISVGSVTMWVYEIVSGD